MSGKKYRKNAEKIKAQKYTPEEAFELLNQFEGSKFDESIDISVRLGVDPKQSDQMVRGAIVLPHGTGKTVRVLVIAKGEKLQEAESSNVDYSGGEDLINKIKAGWVDFDKVIATPDMMGALSKVAKVLGPRGLMPNPKSGTVTFEIKKAIEEQKKGKVEFRIDKEGILHSMIGKKSFGPAKLRENFQTLMEAVIKQKPASSKGVYLRSVAVSSTHSPSVLVDPLKIA